MRSKNSAGYLRWLLYGGGPFVGASPGGWTMQCVQGPKPTGGYLGAASGQAVGLGV